jgi:hypothetical protein
MPEEVAHPRGLDLDRRRGAEVPHPDRIEPQPPHGAFRAVDPVEQVRGDPDAEGDPGRQAGERGLVRDGEIERRRDGPHASRRPRSPR